MLLNIKNPLQRQSNSPEHRVISTQPTCQTTTASQLPGVEKTDQAEGGNRQHDVTAINPIHLAMQTREDSQLGFPFQLKRYERRCDQNAQLPRAGQKDQSWH